MLRGYAYRFNELSQDLGGFRERILPGAGAASLVRNDVTATFNHNRDNVLGRLSAGTLRVGEDDEGGWYEVDLPDTSLGRDLAVLVGRRDVAGASFTFALHEGGHRLADEADEGTGLPIVEITSMDVRELGPVLNPAYVTTSALLRSLEAALAPLPHAPGDSAAERHADTYADTRALVRALTQRSDAV